MTLARHLSAFALLSLAACATPGDAPGVAQADSRFLDPLPEGLAEAAAPGQNLRRVIIAPDDGCYWFEYVGRVETTFLPLRNPSGNPICSRPQT